MTAARSPEFTGRHMWLLVIGFFGVIIAVNIGMAVVASTSWTGLVVSNSYVASQEFEDKRIAHEAQKAAGWQATLTYSPGTARVVIVDGTGQPIDLGSVTLKVNRPVGGHDDRVVLLERTPDGSYAATLTLAAGVWDALVQAPHTAKGPFELHRRFTVGAD
jgi:nitrogen fixation protein FixH